MLDVGANGPRPRIATAVSGNGHSIIGELDDGDPYRWTQAGGLETLAPRLDEPAAISFDGSQVFGRVNYQHPYGGTVFDVSWDGSAVIGQSFSEGYRDIGGVRTWIGDLPGSSYYSEARAISPEGDMIVGASKSLVDVGGQLIGAEVPIYWTEASGIVRLGTWTNGYATDISQAKIVIVGYGNPSLGADGAFRWTPATGTRSIRELLLAEGIDVAAQGWDLATNLPTAVSADGHIIVGTGKNPSGRNEPWLVELSIPGDFDDDGDSDGNDFLFWQRGLGAAHDAADFADWRANIEFAISVAPSSTVAATTAVPEPSAGLLAVLIALAGSRRQQVGA